MALDDGTSIQQVAPRAANRETCVDAGGLTQLLAEKKAERERAESMRRRTYEEILNNYFEFYGFMPRPEGLLGTYWIESG
ncbi:hypothetical protein JDV02_000641 [Purpureocillium takamizusanense]|uniref:Uncharacterized protein n=1 Tax=Purpureocillium takamizusanense TaxID=2060973 RepID=A0A9Q8V6L5_9HYPO|nr:uncharacterized protein JDV02_000641 [Purpureocillium takamizusanense]UNI13954.1 hypothetical protein JDV02_000641 [Purpureocillium takamizusanense]